MTEDQMPLDTGSLKRLSKTERRQRMKKYGLFTPAAIAEACELAFHLPLPRDPIERRQLGTPVRHGDFFRKTIDLPGGVAWVFLKLARARGISTMRAMAEVLTYYAVGMSQEVLDGVPPVYQDLMSPTGVEAMAQAMRLAFEQAGIQPDFVPKAVAQEEFAQAQAAKRIDREENAPFRELPPEVQQELENW